MAGVIDVATLSARSVAQHLRDHCDEPETAGIIDGLCDEIERLVEWESLKDLVCPQGPTSRAATPQDIRSLVRGLLNAAHKANEDKWSAIRASSDSEAQPK